MGIKNFLKTKSEIKDFIIRDTLCDPNRIRTLAEKVDKAVC